MWNFKWSRSKTLLSKRQRPLFRPFLEQLEDRRLFATNITQYHVDSQSTGANLTETQLTSTNVNATTFGQLYNTPLDGQVYAEPLVLTNVTIAAGPNTVGTPGTYNSVVFVATQNDSLYAIDGTNGAILWQRTFLDTTNPNDYLPGATSVSTLSSADVNSDDIYPQIGITSTPVIDPSTNVIYVLPNSKEIVNGQTYFVQRLHAINIADGTDAASSFVIGTTTNGNTNNTPVYVAGTGDGNVNGVIQFNALTENNRPALSLVNGEVYAEWASHGDNGPYHGWVVSWNVSNLATDGMVLSGVLCTDPNGGEGGIWGGGGGLTFDPDETFNGQPAFYFETGNGDPRGGNPPLDANGFPADDNYYESLVKVEADPTTSVEDQNANGWGMKIVDYFTPYNVNALDDADEDFGSGSPLVLPDSAGIPGHPHLIVAAGKEGTIYLLDRDNLGKFNVNDDNVLNSVYNPNTGITTPPVLLNGSLSTPAYYHGEIYWVSGYSSSAYSFVVAPNPDPNPPSVPVATLEPTSETANNNFGYVPGSVVVSANGDEDPQDAVVWIMDRNNGELHAYSALSLNDELWNSGPGSIPTEKFAVPTVANGEVFVGTQDSLQVFGLTGASTPIQAPNAPANVSAEALSGSSVELTWTDSTGSPNFATNYAIQESTDGINFTTVANAGQESTSYTVTGLNQNTTYYFQIVGSNSAGSSGSSNLASATTTNQTGQTPTGPVGLGATPASGSEVYLTWTNTATNETGFTLTRATDSLFTQNVVTETLASAPYYYTDGAAGLSPGNTYYYKLQATNSSGLSSSSNTASVSIPNVPPAPTDASAIQNGNQVELSWTDNAGPFALGYQISRSIDGGPFAIYADRPETSDAPPTTQTFTDTNVPLGYSYTYEIVAENVSGFSPPAYATVSVLGSATLSLDNSGNLDFTSSPGVPDRLSVQLTAGIYTLTDYTVTITATGAGAGAVTGSGTSTVTIPAANVSAMTLDSSDYQDTIQIISDAAPITITADSGGGDPTINLGDPTNDEIISGTITNASNGQLLISGAGITTITGNLICQGNGGITLAGSGTINISGNIDLGQLGNLLDSGSGQDTITGVISGAATSGFGLAPGLVGTYFNLPYQAPTSPLIYPADPSNSAWLGNQSPAVTSILVGPIDFPDIADNGFADSVGDPNYYNLGGGNNNNVEARWSGDILIPGAGTNPIPINFATTSDDGSMLYIDGNAVVFNDYNQGATQRTGLAYLTPGLHTIDVEYYQGYGGASMDAQWDPTGGSNFVDIPSSAFSSIQPVNGLTMTGMGTLTLSNTNTYLGATTINAGTVVVTTDGAMGSATATGIVVNPGGTLAFSGGLNYTTAEPITISGAGPAGNGAIENLSGNNTFAIPIIVSGTAVIGSDAGTLTLGGTITCQGAGVTLAGSGAIDITGNINLGLSGTLTDTSSGQDTTSGVISGTATSGFVDGLTGTYFNLPASQNLIQPADPSNSAWLGNQTPAVTAPLIGPLDFPDIADNGFADSAGDPNYYNLGGGNNNNVEARWVGEILIPGTGTNPIPINFATTSDDGSMLYIDGNAVVFNNEYQGATQRTGLAYLTPGLHTIDVEYFQGYYAASMDLQWDPAGGTKFVDIPNYANAVSTIGLTMNGTGTLTLGGTITCQSGGVTLAGSGTINIIGNINLGLSGTLTDTSSGQDTISGVISGTATSGFVEGLTGTYFNLPASPNLIQPADPSNPAWLGNQTPAVTAPLIGPLDFPDIADNGFADSVGDPNYYDVGQNVEARWVGDILIPGTGTALVPINFATTCDDGSMLYIDGNAVVFNNYFQPATQRTGLAYLTPGFHTIDVEYYQGGGGASLDVQWDPTGGTNFVDIPNYARVEYANGLTLAGTGTLTLSNTSTYLGKTTINAGTLVVTADGAMGPATAAGIVVNPGGALAFTGGLNYSTAEPITISGAGPAGNGAIENISGSNTIAIPITVSGTAVIGSDAGTLTLGGTIICQGAGVTLTGSGAINITGNVNLGLSGTLTDTSSGQDTISGVISGTATSGFVEGLTGTYFNLPASQNLIQPADASNPAWLGNQTPAVTAPLIGPLDFPDIADNGFADSAGDPNYYNLGGGNNNNVEARWVGEILIPGTSTNPIPINFATTSDDGSMLYIDGNAVVFNNYYQAATQRTGLAYLTPGLHTIDVEYFQGYVFASIDVQWDPTGGTNFVDIPNYANAVSTGGLTMAGTGTLTLSNTNTYLGATTINAGTLVVTADGAMGPATAAGIVVNPGGALAITGGLNYTTAEPITISGSGPAGNGSIENLSGSNSFAIPINVVGNAAIGSDAGTLTLGGTISVGPNTLTVVGAGNTIVNGVISSAALPTAGLIEGQQDGNIDTTDAPNPAYGTDTQLTPFMGETYSPLPGSIMPTTSHAWATNDTWIYQGQIYIGNTNGNGTGTVSFAKSFDDSTFLSIAGVTVLYDTSWTNSIGTGPLTFSAGWHTFDLRFANGAGPGGADGINNNGWTGFVANSIGFVMRIDTGPTDPLGQATGGNVANYFIPTDNGSGNLFRTGPIPGLSMAGAGTLTLNATNTYFGPTTVNAGKLVVNGQLLNSPVTVNAGGTLGGDGTVQATTVQSGGFLSPGDSPGTLTAANLSLAAGSTFNEELGGTTAGTQYDQTVIPAGGSVALGSANLNISLLNGFQPTVGQQFTIISNQSGSSVNGIFGQGTPIVGTPIIADPGFASPNVVGNGSYTYNPTGTPWTFTGSAGIEADGSAWGAATAPDGDGRAGFLQGASGAPLGGISQSLYLAPGIYTISFDAAQRGGFGIQPIQFSVNGTNVGNTITPTSTNWSQYTTAKFTVTTTGTYTIQLAATDNNGDNDSFIDDVSITQVIPYSPPGTPACPPGKPIILDYGFASPNVVGNGSYTYNPTGTPWTFTGSAGIEADGSAWGAANAPDGDGRAAFLQGYGGGTLGGMSQSVYLAPGIYTISFEAAPRAGFGIQPIQFSVNGTDVGSPITPASTQWGRYTTTKFTINTAGTYTLQLAATNNNGDNDSFIDDVSIAEAGTVVSNGYIFGINYSGNGGHDVVLTVLASIKPVAEVTYDGKGHGTTGQILGVNNTVQNAAIVYTNSTNQVLHSAPVDAGTYTATVFYPGNNTYPATSVSTTIVIGTAATSTSISADPGNPASPSYGEPLTFTATITDTANPSVIPTGGTVSFYSGSILLKKVKLTNGLAKVVLTNVPRGKNTITAVYNGLMGANGVADFSGSTSPTGVLVTI